MDRAENSEQTRFMGEELATWRQQAGTIPTLLGGKAIWVPLTLELVRQLGEKSVRDLDATPDLPEAILLAPPVSTGVPPMRGPATWRQYFAFLRGVGLATNGDDGLSLTITGRELLSDRDPQKLGSLLADRVRLFAETVALLNERPLTVEEVHDDLVSRYQLSWKQLGNVRSRLDWQEKLGLIEPLAHRRWGTTSAGKTFLEGRLLVSPEALEKKKSNLAAELTPTPSEISSLLDELRESVREHGTRSTYNIWAPSPTSSPNKVENLRVIVNAATTRIDRAELFDFICNTFDLKRSSVESMMPFMRAAGMLVEVGRGVYEATPAARAWIESDDDVNFIRLLHAHMRFVGEMIRVAEADVTRSTVYAAGKSYGLNVDKCRWIASFLLNTGLLEEPRYGSLRATEAGMSLARELPLADAPEAIPHIPEEKQEEPSVQTAAEAESIQARLVQLAEHPTSANGSSGQGFEQAVRDAFRSMGFHARTIGGSGDTDVVVRWQLENGESVSAIVEAKSRTNGHVAHGDISDVALETHKARNGAEHVAVIGPAFSGNTIRNMAEHRDWSLIEAERLGSIAEAVIQLGLQPREAALLFESAKGLAELDDLIAERTRELDVVAFVLAKLQEELEETGEAISARDISRDGRKTELAPSVAEVVAGIETLTKLQLTPLRQVEVTERAEYSTYVLGDAGSSARRLRALAEAIERHERR